MTSDVMNDAIADRLRAASGWSDRMVDFARRLIQIPSLSGEEKDVADLTAAEMTRLGYDEVTIDEAGNVIGLLRGTDPAAPSVQFNTHLDHVAPGDLNFWPHPPYEAAIEDGILYGRGACDIKGAQATQVYLLPVLKAAGLAQRGNVYVTGVVLEEVGGFGTQRLCGHLKTDIAVLGEATNLRVNRGHRGRILLKVEFTGLSAHASAPDRARNPHFAAARLLLGVEHLRMRPHPLFGGSSVAPTISKIDQLSANVTPAVVTLYLDWRNVPGESADDVVAIITPLAEAAAVAVEGIGVTVEVVGRTVTSYTGIGATMPPTRPFETPADHISVRTAVSTLERVLGREMPVGTWTFSTDGGHFSHHGIRTIGFAPGEERHAHTIHDQVRVNDLIEATIGNAALALALTACAREEVRA